VNAPVTPIQTAAPARRAAWHTCAIATLAAIAVEAVLLIALADVNNNTLALAVYAGVLAVLVPAIRLVVLLRRDRSGNPIRRMAAWSIALVGIVASTAMVLIGILVLLIVSSGPNTF
jgi:uncharacterized protein YhhL (DUF1145 family)